MQMRTNLARWSVIVVPAIAALTACSDAPTAAVSPQNSEVARATLLTTAANLTGKTVVIFKDTASIPVAGLSLINSLGGVVTKRWDDIGVAFVGGLPLTALTTLRASDLVKSVGQDRYINWLPETTS